MDRTWWRKIKLDLSQCGAILVKIGLGPIPKMAAKICYAGFVWAFLGIQFTIVAMNLFRLVLVFKVII